MTEQKKKVEEDKAKSEDDKAMADEDKRQLDTRLDERINEVQKLTHNQFDVINQLLSANHEIVGK